MDQESVHELEKIKKNKHYAQKVFNSDSVDKDKDKDRDNSNGKKRIQTPINTGRSKNNIKVEEKTKSKINSQTQL